jgi:hypothetical protein
MRGRMGGMKQFSIRDLLFIVAIVALALGWWLNRHPTSSRFELRVSGGRAFVLDKSTGQVWTELRSLDRGEIGDGGLLAPKVPPSAQ